MSDWTTTDLKSKSKRAANYTDTANIPIGDETYEFPYELLSQDERLDIQADIDLTSVADAVADDDEVDEAVEEAEQVVQELQDKEDLTDEEEQRLEDAQTTLLRNRGELMDAMGKDTFMAFHRAGRQALEPDEEDVSNVIADPVEARERFAEIDGAPTPDNGEWTRPMAREALRCEMRAILDEVPFLVYFTLGQQVWEESQSAGKLVEN